MLGCFQTYAGALLDFSVMLYVQVRGQEYHDAEDWDALQEARREYDELEHHVRLEGANRKEQDGHLRDSSDEEEEERPYEVLNLENVRKTRKRPGAPKWTVRLSKTLRDYLQQPERAEEHSLANARWEVMRKMDRQGSAYLKEQWKKKAQERKEEATQGAHKGEEGGPQKQERKRTQEILSPVAAAPAIPAPAGTVRHPPSLVAEVDARRPRNQRAPDAKERWRSGSWTGGGSFGLRKASGGSTVPTCQRYYAPSVVNGTGTTRHRPLPVGPDYESMEGARCMSWTRGGSGTPRGHTAVPRCHTVRTWTLLAVNGSTCPGGEHQEGIRSSPSTAAEAQSGTVCSEPTAGSGVGDQGKDQERRAEPQKVTVRLQAAGQVTASSQDCGSRGLAGGQVVGKEAGTWRVRPGTLGADGIFRLAGGADCGPGKRRNRGAGLHQRGVLRVGEAATVRTSTRGDVRFNGEKGRPGIWDVEVGPWTKWWLLFREIRRPKPGRADLPFSFQNAAELQAGWKKIVGGSDFEGYRWHALRRCGAAVLWFWGARIQTVMLAGGWVTPSFAKDYCHPTHAWSCERRMHLPVPVD